MIKTQKKDVIKRMLENESEIMERIYGFNILKEDDIIPPKKRKKKEIIIENLYVSDHLSRKAKLYLFLGFQLLIIAAHILFFILRIFNI